jgi:hypothetical protein
MGPDFATDVIGDPWDMSNVEDVAIDPAQRTGWTGFGFSGGRVGGTTAAVDGAVNGTNLYLLQRAYWGSINPGRTGARYPIPSTTYTKMESARADQSPRIYWFQNDLGSPGGDVVGIRYVNPTMPTPAGNQIFVVDLTQALLGGSPWTAAPARGFALFPNSSAVGYNVQFDWVRITTSDGHPASATHVITWSGGSGTSTIQVIDAAGTTMTIATGLSGTSYSWNYGVLPPGTYTLRVIRGTSTANQVFRINNPPTLRVTDPDETGGEDFATAVLGNPWDMSDGGDVGTVFEDHLLSAWFSGGQFHGTSDGVPVAYSSDGVPVGDPIVYTLTANGTIDPNRFRYLTFRLQVDRAYDLLRGSVARVFWGSNAGPPNSGAPYDVTVSKDMLVWPGMNTYTVDLASLTTAPDGGIVTSEGAGRLWTEQPVRYFRIDPHEFAEVIDFHIDDVKLAAMDETSGGTFRIRFTGADADGDAVTVALYYDTNTNPADGRTLITASVPLATGEYVWNTAGVPVGVYYIQAVASDGRNAFATYATGPIRISSSAPAGQPAMSLDGPQNGASTGQTFEVHGWAIDRAAPSGTGIDAVHVYAYPNPGSGQAPIFLGLASTGYPRGDVGAIFGSQFTNSGYRLTASLLPGPYLIAAYAHSTVSGGFDLRTASMTVAAGPLMSIDQPAPSTGPAQPFTISGWSIDTAAGSGTGVDTLHVWAYPNPGSGAPPVFVGAAAYGASRPDVGAAYGSRYTNSGYSLLVKGLPPGPYQFVVFSHSTATGTFNAHRTLNLTVYNSPQMALDRPGAGPVGSSFTISGWAIDLAAATGTGVNAIHVWGYRNGGAAQFLGTATYGTARGDVGAAFGSSQFSPSGYSLTINSLASGTWDIVVYARSNVSGTFDNWRIVRVTR